MSEIEQKAIEWASARAAFLELSPGSSETRTALNRLAEAEDALFKIARPKS